MKAHARILVLLLALAMLLSACGSQEPSGGEPEVKDTLIVGNSAEPTVLDPPNQQNTPAGLINVQVYDGLLRQNNETGEIEPCLAESWEYVDDCTVRFHLRDDVYGRNPVGTGAYKFVEWIAGDRVVLERNEEYWGELPEFKNLIIRTIADDTTRGMALESGEIDIAVGLSTSQVETLSNSESVDVIPFMSYSLQYCGLNGAYEPLSDKRVRQALRYAVDMDTMSEIAFGSGVVADGPISPAMSCYVPAGEDQQYEQDIEKAKQLLKEAGYENGFDLELVCNESQGRITMAEMLANAWNAIGVKTELRTLEFSALVDLVYSGETQAFLLGFLPGGNDGEFYRTLFQTGGENAAWINYSNPEVDELFDLASKEMDSEKRNEYYAELQTILRDEMPWLWIRFTDNVFGMQKTLTGLDPDPETYCEFRFVKTK